MYLRADEKAQRIFDTMWDDAAHVAKSAKSKWQMVQESGLTWGQFESGWATLKDTLLIEYGRTLGKMWTGDEYVFSLPNDLGDAITPGTSMHFIRSAIKPLVTGLKRLQHMADAASIQYPEARELVILSRTIERVKEDATFAAGMMES
jgi:hypothetical protein